jgi:transcriptional regulator GlxA family with amidase domain
MAELVGATGNGALVLAAAGLIEGRRAAVHWAYRGDLERLGATSADGAWVVDGRFWTAAGGAAGIDMSLALLAHLTGERGARLAQLFIEYDPEPPFGGIDRTDTDEELAAVLRSPSRSATRKGR